MSSYSWTFPLGGGGSSGPLPQAVLASEIDKLFGRDIWLDVSASTADRLVTPAGDWRLVGGHEALRQSLMRRYVTNPGEWQTKQNYGAGLRLFVKSRNTPAARDELMNRVRAQSMADQRVEAVSQIVLDFPADGAVRLAVGVLPKGLGRRNSPLVVTVEV